MAALTADRPTPRKSQPEAIKAGRFYVHAAKKIFAGSMVMENPADEGFIMPAVSTAAGNASSFVAFSPEHLDNSAGADGDIYSDRIEVRGVYLFNVSDGPLTLQDLGKPAFVADDQTVKKTGAAGDTIAGRFSELYEPDATKVWVYLSGPFKPAEDVPAEVAE